MTSRFVAALVLAASVGTAVAGGASPAYRSVHAFGLGADPRSPDGGVISDAGGTRCGVSRDGGQHGRGTVCTVDPASGQASVLYAFRGAGALGVVCRIDALTHTESVLHTFAAGGDGEQPGAGLRIEGAGELVGPAPNGGANDTGTIFALPS